MNKKQLREWPWNNMPSNRHVWKMIGQSQLTGHSAKCERCGRVFIEKADTRGPVYCYATSQWLALHPDDDNAQG